MLIFAKAARAALFAGVVAASGCFAGNDGFDDDVSTHRGGATTVDTYEDVEVDDDRDVPVDDDADVVTDDDADFIDCQADCEDERSYCLDECSDSVCDAICDDDENECLNDCE